MKLSILVHNICLILPIFFLFGCIGYTPTYYDDNIEFVICSVSGKSYSDNNDIKVYVDDKEVVVNKQKGCDYSSKNKYKAKEVLYLLPKEYKALENDFVYNISFEVKRERKNKIIKITSPDNSDKIINLHYQITDEKWASGKAEGFSKKETTAAILLLPTNTYEVVLLFSSSVVEVFKGNVIEGGGITIASLAWIPVAVGIDVYNIVIGLPSTAIVNPWTNYKIYQQNVEGYVINKNFEN